MKQQGIYNSVCST